MANDSCRGLDVIKEMVKNIFVFLEELLSTLSKA